MPSETWSPACALTASGRNVDFALLHYANWDLHDWGYTTAFEYEEARYWINQYKSGLAMPGFQRFRCTYTNEMVFFTTYLDGLFEMMCLAVAEIDLTEDEDDVTDPDVNIDIADVDIWFPWPINIGRFGLGPMVQVTTENAPPNIH